MILGKFNKDWASCLRMNVRLAASAAEVLLFYLNISFYTEKFGFGMREDVANLFWRFLPDSLLCLIQWFRSHDQRMRRGGWSDLGVGIWCGRRFDRQPGVGCVSLVSNCVSLWRFCSSDLFSSALHAAAPAQHSHYSQLLPCTRLSAFTPQLSSDSLSTLDLFWLLWQQASQRQTHCRFVFIKSEYSWKGSAGSVLLPLDLPFCHKIS